MNTELITNWRVWGKVLFHCRGLIERCSLNSLLAPAFGDPIALHYFIMQSALNGTRGVGDSKFTNSF